MRNKNYPFGALLLVCVLGMGFCQAAEVPKKITTGTVKIKAGVVLNNGDVKYVAKQDFYLVSKSIAEIKNTLMSKEAIDSFAPEEPFCPNRVKLLDGVGKELETNAKVYEMLKPYIKATCRTSFLGECSFVGIKPGNYFLVGDLITQINQNLMSWDMVVSVSPGKTQHIELSNDNAYQFWPLHDRNVSTEIECSSY